MHLSQDFRETPGRELFKEDFPNGKESRRIY